MRAVLQRVSQASVTVDDATVGSIGPGLVVLLGVAEGDDEDDAQVLVDRIVHLRIFPDDAGKMNRSALDVGAELLVVPQFTLFGDCWSGRRPSFTEAAPPVPARALYEGFVEQLACHPLSVATGEFGAMMMVHLTNWGPVTLLIDTDGTF